MITSQEYRRMAEECFGWAREAQTDEVRLCYVNLAQTWLEAAAWIEDAWSHYSRASCASIDQSDPPRKAA
jgi:hypothetical protein